MQRAAPPKAKPPITAQASGLARTIGRHWRAAGPQAVRSPKEQGTAAEQAVAAESLRFQGQRERR